MPKRNGFAPTAIHVWLKKRAPLFHPIRKLELANVFRAVDELRELTLRFYWSPVFTMSFVIGKSDNCGFGFMTLN